MSSLPAESEFALRCVVKGPTGGLDDDLLDQLWPLLGQGLGSGGQAETGSRGQDIFDDQVGAVILPQRDDAPLGVASVALLQLGSAGDECDLSLRVLCQPQCGRCAGDPAADDQYVGLSGAHRLTSNIRSSATRAERATWGGTVTGLMTSPFTSPSTTRASLSSVIMFIVSQ